MLRKSMTGPLVLRNKTEVKRKVETGREKTLESK